MNFYNNIFNILWDDLENFEVNLMNINYPKYY
jgi:hypothetical protein